MHRLLLVALLGLCACSGAVSDHPPDKVTSFLPATLEATRPRTGDPRTVKVRVYADAGVRALPHWREDISDQLDYASQLLQPLVGARLAVDSIKDWTRTGDPHDALRSLTETDDAKDVTWVIGYVTPGDAASKAMSELGDAQPLGHHVVVRAWSEKPETDALAGKLPDLKDAQRSEVLGAHRRHKQTVVLLHMLAATLGAVPEADPAWIQHVAYSPKQNTFSDRNRELLQLAIDARLADEPDVAIARKLLDAIEKSEYGGWIPTGREDVVAVLKLVVDAGKAGKTASDIPSGALEEYNRIQDLAKHGQIPVALTELENLLAAYPGNATMHELKCEIMIGKPGVADKTTRAACARVAELAPGDPTVHIVLGEALIRVKDVAGARTELAAAEDKIGNLPVGAADAWRRLIAIYQALGSLTWTEGAIAKAKLENDPSQAKVDQTRARYGIPRGAKFVAPEQEAALVAAIRAALDLVYANKFGEADKALAAAEKKWPGAPGLLATRCDLAFRMGQFDAAHAACNRALAADPDASWALYLQGVLLLRDAGTSRQGAEKLKRAIAVDPELGQAWRTLAKAYVRDHKTTELFQLSKDYQAKFGTPLPP